MSKPIISIVVPAYNCEKLIGRTMNSLIPQLTEEIELVLVDDGSTDKTPQICEEFAAKYNNIIVVHKKNGGLSSARNAGIVAASGEYISFVDGDDMMADGAYQRLLKVIKEYSPDMIDFGWRYFGVGGVTSDNLHSVTKEVLLPRSYIEKVIIPPMINVFEDKKHHIYPFSCMKMFKKQIIVSNNIYFDESRRIWEDQPFVANYLKYIENFYSINECLYYYMATEGSLSGHFTTDFFRIILANYTLYKELFSDEYDFETQYVYDYWSASIENMIFRSLEEKNNQEEIEKVVLQTLGNQQVIEWFSKRTNKDNLEKRISQSIVDGQVEIALSLLRKKNVKQKKQKKATARKQSLKKKLKRLFKKEKLNA